MRSIRDNSANTHKRCTSHHRLGAGLCNIHKHRAVYTKKGSHAPQNEGFEMSLACTVMFALNESSCGTGHTMVIAVYLVCASVAVKLKHSSMLTIDICRVKRYILFYDTCEPV